MLRPDFVDQIQEVLRFLQSLWGVLAGVSTLFPLSSRMFKVIPLEEWHHGEESGGFGFGLRALKPNLILLVATVLSLFSLFLVIILGEWWNKISLTWVCLISVALMLIGIRSLVRYLRIYNQYEIPNPYHANPSARLAHDLDLMFFYTVTFISFTLAFTLPAYKIYLL